MATSIALVAGSLISGAAFLGGIPGSLFKRGRSRPYFAHAEFWVYLPGVEMPSQDKIMDRMMYGNPHRPGGKFPIGKDEALIFSDVRLHMALVLRARNAHVFRPDLFEEHVEPTQERLEGLADSQCFVKVRFISEEPLKNLRHLRFLAHAAAAIATLGEGKVIYDVVAEKLYTAEEFGAQLDQVDADSPDLQSQVIWKRSHAGGVAETRGLVKVGLPELVTEEMNADQQVLVKAILEGVIREVWNLPELPQYVDVRFFDDPYRVEIKPRRKGPAHVALMRMPSGL